MRHTAILAACLAALPASAEPNVVIILADDLGYGDVGAYGGKDIPTPHIDSLAKDGVRFTDGYANHPVCSPSRAGLLSGRYQHRFGFEHNSGPERFASPKFGIPKTVPTLAEKLKARGYATAWVGKWHVGFRDGLRPHERGFDFTYGFLSGARSFYPKPRRGDDPLYRNGRRVNDEGEYLTDAFARESVAFIDRNRAKPFFLYLAFNAVHAPLQATAAYEGRFPHITDAKRKTYAGMLAAMDDAVGRVLQTLKKHGLEKDTLVAFYSDNGGPTARTTSRNDPLRGFKGQMYEGGIRVPFLMRWTGKLPAGKVYRDMVMGFDVHATAAAAAGADAGKIDGVNLLPYLSGANQGKPHDRLFWRAGNSHAARAGDWKLVKPRREPTQLFNLKADIGEKTDLAASHPSKLKELQAAYDAWAAEMTEPRWVRQDGRNAEPGGKLKPNAGRGQVGRLEQIFRRADRDRDGKLSRQEFPRPDVFDAVDKNGDGAITLDEVQAHYGRGRPNRGKPASGLFREQQRVEMPAGPLAVGVLDADGDGKLDLVLPHGRGSGRFSLAINDGDEFAVEQLSMSDDPRHARRRRATKGLGLHDFDNDGRLDIYLANRGSTNSTRSLGPDGKTVRPADRWSSSVNSVQLNRGGKFVTRDLGIDSKGGEVRSLVFADFDGDGHFDSYHSVAPYYGPGWGGSSVGNELHRGTEAWDKFGRDVIQKTLPNKRFWQDEHGRGVVMSKAALARDLDGDGKPDLVFGTYADIWGGSFRRLQTPADAKLDLDNDGTPDTTWPGSWQRGLFVLRNASSPGQVRFEDVSRTAVTRAHSDGTEYPQMHVYAILAADIDRDADLDLLVTGPRNVSAHRSVEDATPTARLLRNDSTPGRLKFTDITEDAGFGFLNARRVPGYGRRGVPNLAAGVAIDLENDGDVDFVFADRRDGAPADAPLDPWVFRNDGGKFVRLKAGEHGLTGHFNDMSSGDFDGDGRVDLVFVNGGTGAYSGRRDAGRAVVFKNAVANDNRWVGVQVTWPANKLGLGTKVTVFAAGTDTVIGHDELRTDFCYRSKRAPRLHFGLGNVSKIDVRVVTRGGHAQRFLGLPADKVHTLKVTP